MAGSFRIRIIDTTLFCPWFFSGSGFEAFVLVKNTTNTARAATVTLYSPTGVSLGTQSGMAPINGSYNLQVSAAIRRTGSGWPPRAAACRSRTTGLRGR